MTPGDFPQLMADVKQFQAVLEQVMEMARNPREKELLGAALQNIRNGVAEAEATVPHAFQMIEEHARKAQVEADELKEEFARKQVEAEALKADDDRREAARRAAQVPQDFGPLARFNGLDLRLEMLDVLGLRPADVIPQDQARSLGHHREIWEDWHWE